MTMDEVVASLMAQAESKWGKPVKTDSQPNSHVAEPFRSILNNLVPQKGKQP
jgi:hypothetical protein